MATTWPGRGPAFVGRRRELERLGALVRGPNGGSAVVRGAAGLGKSALLGRLADMAPGRVLHARGVESEAVLPFAAAADLLMPLREFFPQLPAAQREALEVSLALRDGPGAGPLATCLATLGVLAAAAERTPLLVVVDDLQWVDPSSQQALMFTALRLSSDPAVLIMAVRDELGVPRVPIDLPTVELGGLSVAECADLVRAMGAATVPLSARELHERTGGNPLAIVELLRSGQDVRGFPDNDVGMAALALRRMWANAVDRLPERVRDALFVLAASRSAAAADLGRSLGRLGMTLDDLVPAEGIGLIGESGGEIRLRHPLLRAVIIEHTPLAVRLDGYRALADSADADLRPWYLAAAATGPDEAVALALVAAAQTARRRGGYGASARAWRRAAQLTGDAHERAARLLEGAGDAMLAGAAELVVPWCEEALSIRDGVVFAADVERVRARARMSIGQPQLAHDELVAAAERVRDVDLDRGVALFAEAAMAGSIAGDVGRSVQAARRCESALPAGRRPVGVTVVSAVASLEVGDVAAARTLLDDADRMIEPADMVGDQLVVVGLGQGMVWAEQHERARSRLDAVVEAARLGGAPMALAYALAVRSELETWTGQWTAAYADAEESLRWAEELGQATWIGKGQGSLARLEAARGESVLCRARIERPELERVDGMRVHIPALLGLCALSEGRPELAVEHLEQAHAAASAAGLGTPTIVPVAGDLLEALVDAGDKAGAAALLGWIDERAAVTGLTYPAVVAARCRGMLAGDADAAAGHFATAHALHARRPMPFERARTLFAQARTLRALRRVSAARPLLRDALTAFEMLGAHPWAERVATELAAAGGRRRGSDDDEIRLDVLTGPEFQIARAVADGRSNVEVAAALFVSRKTVESQLTKIYRKLGLRSRTELARRFLTNDSGH